MDKLKNADWIGKRDAERLYLGRDGEKKKKKEALVCKPLVPQ